MRKPTTTPDWYKRRGYAHFDDPLSANSALGLVALPSNIAKHSFYPFISFDIESRRYKKANNKVEDKKRHVAFAAHADAHILAFYSAHISRTYEDLLAKRDLSDVVLAYRRFSPPQSNIQLANGAFNEIVQRRSCTGVALDIKSYYDTIPHNALKRAWCQVLSVERLPDDHYAVYKAITQYAHVPRVEVYRALGIGRRRARKLDAKRLCSPEEFRTKIRDAGLIRRGLAGSKGDRGIPQGAPISALLSNIVLLDFDKAISDFCRSRGASYRRYCDDILLIANDKEVAGECRRQVATCLDELGLNLNSDKDQVTEFLDASGSISTKDVPLQYLGFTFDGLRRLVRSGSIAKYYARMMSAVSVGAQEAKSAKRDGLSSLIRRQKLYSRFTHLRPRKSSGVHKGTFLNYIGRAARIMESDQIKHQLRNHWRRLHNKLYDAQGNV